MREDWIKSNTVTAAVEDEGGGDVLDINAQSFTGEMV